VWRVALYSWQCRSHLCVSGLWMGVVCGVAEELAQGQMHQRQRAGSGPNAPASAGRLRLPITRSPTPGIPGLCCGLQVRLVWPGGGWQGVWRHQLLAGERALSGGEKLAFGNGGACWPPVCGRWLVCSVVPLPFAS
jgi:hypothetical protein